MKPVLDVTIQKFATMALTLGIIQFADKAWKLRPSK